MKILIPGYEHGYREATIIRTKVVYNKNYYPKYTAYHGEEYLDEGDEVLEMDVAE